MNRRNMLLAIAATSVLPISGVAMAQTASLEKGKMDALMGGDYATATSQLASRKARNRLVKTFAELEITEQAAVAKAFGSRPGAAGLSRRHAMLLEKLAATDGANFDMMYINGQIAGHEELLSIHKRYARSGSDPMARGASMVGVPAIQSHLVMLRGMRGMLS